MQAVRPVLLLAFLAIAACYRYVPAEPARVVPGQDVRTRLTGEGMDAMRGFFGPGVIDIEGKLVRWDRQGVTLLFETFVTRPGFPATTIQDTIQLQPWHVDLVERKELDGRRSVLAGAAVVSGAITALISSKAFGSGGNPGESPEPEPDELIIIRLPFP